MRVFVTGATGFIGSAIVGELITAGHTVLGLARSDAAAKSLIAAGAEVHRGDLDDLEACAAARGGRRRDPHRLQPRLLEVQGELRDRPARHRSARRSARRLRPAVDRHVRDRAAAARAPRARRRCARVRPAIPRVASEEAAAAVAARGVRVAVVRLPPTVHGDGDHGFVPMLIGIAREKGVSAYVGDGRNRWPAVHRLDAAQLLPSRPRKRRRRRPLSRRRRRGRAVPRHRST